MLTAAVNKFSTKNGSWSKVTCR